MCIFWDQKAVVWCEFLESGETVNNCSLPATNDKFQLCIDSKVTKMLYETQKSDFAAWHVTLLAHSEKATDFQLPLVFIDASCTLHEKLQQLPRYRKMARLLYYLKSCTVFLGGHLELEEG